MRIHESKTARERDRGMEQLLKGRPAFTLIEMLVVVSIILVITVAVVAVAPRFTDDRKLARAADQLAQILLTTKQRTKRDLVPTGVRLFLNPSLAGQGKGNLVTELQYIQQPDDFAPTGSTVTLTAVPNSAAIDAQIPASVIWPRGWGGLVMVAQGTPPLDFTSGFSNSALWPVQPGDYLNVKGTAHLILAVFPLVTTPTVVPSTLVLAPVAPFQPPPINISGALASPPNTLQFNPQANTAQIATGMSITGLWAGATVVSTNTIRSVNNTTIPMSITLGSAPGTGPDWIGFLPASAVSTSPQATSYSVIRQPRVLQGETPLTLPAGICIDATWPKFPGDQQDAFIPADPITGNIDIMFSPQGNVLNVRGRDTLLLWVRDYTKDVTYPVTGWPPGGTPGDQFLIQLQTHTGFIAEHPVDVGSADPYSFTKDARSSGL